MRRLIGAVLLLVSLAGQVLAHGEVMRVGSSQPGSGQLLVEPEFDFGGDVFYLPQAAQAGGLTLYSDIFPSFAWILTSGGGFNPLGAGVTVTIAAAAPISGGGSIRVAGTTLDAPGESTILGSFENDPEAHVHAEWRLLLANGVTGQYQISFRLSAPGYTQSPVYTLLVTNQAPAPTPSSTPTSPPTSTPQPTATDTPEPTATATPQPTATPTSDASATATVTVGIPTGFLPPLVDADQGDLDCQKAIAGAVRKLGHQTYQLIGKCMDAAHAHAMLEKPADPAMKSCSIDGLDQTSLVGRIATEEAKALDAIERKCGPLGVASSPYTLGHIAAHLDLTVCLAEELAGSTYNRAVTSMASLLEDSTDHDVQLAFPCMKGSFE